MTEVYEKPVINKLLVGQMNRYGSPDQTRKIRTHLDDVPVSKLVDVYGSPLFVYSEQTIRRKHREMSQSFSTRYPNFEMAWSYKTNYLSAICALMHQQGSAAEVVSEMEYEKARALGISGDQIIYNGPYKPYPSLLTAAREKATINIDHPDEIDMLEAVASELGQPVKAGLRLNLDAGIYPVWSRFGFNLESGQALEAVRRMAVGRKLEFSGLHCHIGTFILDPQAYARQVEKMTAFAYEIEDRFGFSLEYLDLGGGLPSRNRLKGLYLPPDVGVPAVDEYAEHICRALLDHLRPGHFPKLIMESGRALIDEAGYLITSVAAAKRLPDGTRAYVLDAGINLLYTSNWYRFNIEMDRAAGEASEYSVLYGPLCMNIDVMDEGLMLPPLETGTRLVFSPVGAYNNTQWQQFIHYRPNVVLIGENGEVDLIREAEDLSDINRREKMPTRLRTDMYYGEPHELLAVKSAA